MGMETDGPKPTELLQRLSVALGAAESPVEVGAAFSGFGPDLSRLLRVQQLTLIACERNREWVSVIGEHPAGANVLSARPAREVALDAVGSFPDGIEFFPAESAAPAAAQMAAAGFTHAWAGPLLVKGATLGMLSMARRPTDRFDESDLGFAREVGSLVAARLGVFASRARAAEEAARGDLVSEVCRWPDGDEAPQELFTRLQQLLWTSVPAEGGMLFESDGLSDPRLLASAGCVSNSGIPLRLINDHVSANDGKPVIEPQSPAGSRLTLVPLRRAATTIGVLALTQSGGVPPSTRDLEFLGFLSTVLAQALVSRQREAQLRAAERRYQHLFHTAPAMYAIIGVETAVPLIVDCNALFLKTLGYSKRDVIGKPLSQFDPSERSTREGHPLSGVGEEERILVAQSGHVIDTLLRTTPEYDSNGKIVALCAMYIDMSERNNLQRQLAHQAFHDPLTDLPNRVLFLDRLGHALRRNSGVAVALLDLDDFKVVNDSLGHASGDDLLVAVARRLSAFLMPADTIARMGGDEFTILLEDPGSEDGALARMEALAQAFEVPFQLGEREVYIDASIGLIFETDPDIGAEELLRRADVAMYEGKRNGKGEVQLFDEKFQHIARHRLDLETELRVAIETGQITPWYQPVINLVTGELAEMEALARWDHPQRGILQPSEFIDMAEANGLIIPLGRAILRKACSDAKRWIEAFDLAPTFRVAVNVSVKQLEQPRIVEEVLAILEEIGLPPNRLKLEVTESIMLSEGDGAVAKLERLVAAGVGIAIDDFGTGYSSLSNLKRLPVDTVKIDRSFVSGLGTEGRDTAIVQAVVAFAESIGLTVTVEGVETLSQVNAVRGLGCDLGQGYYFSRPVPAAQLEAFLGTKRLAA